MPSQSFFPQAEQTQVTQPFLIREMHSFLWTSADSVLEIPVFFELVSPGLDTLV